MKNIIYISLLLLTNTALGQRVVELENQGKKYIVGSEIVLNYCILVSQADQDYSLIIDNGTAKIHISERSQYNSLKFELPTLITQKSGVVMIRLFDQSAMIHQSHFEVLPDISKPEKVESYCGPKHLVVNRDDFSMIVSTVLDRYGNPLPEDEQIMVGYQAMKSITEKPMNMRPLFGFQKLYAPEKKGYGNIVGKYNHLSGKAFRLDYYAVDPRDFEISFERQHVYADGEQLVMLTTEVIKDESDNLIGNGTIVKFQISNDSGEKSELYAQTKDGVATAIRYAPEKAEKWLVVAEINNYASNLKPLVISFEASVTDYSLQYIERENQIVIGPVKGFMDQWMKNGTLATIEISNAKTQKLFQKPLENGKIILPVDQLQLTKGKYSLTATVAGVSKNINFSIND